LAAAPTFLGDELEGMIAEYLNWALENKVPAFHDLKKNGKELFGLPLEK
jgi:hypothetical protein